MWRILQCQLAIDHKQYVVKLSFTDITTDQQVLQILNALKGAETLHMESFMQ